MNVPVSSANEDDEDFPVFKAGPPLPIRTKSTKTHPKIKSTPLKATAAINSHASSIVKHNSASNNQAASSASSTSISHAESKVKQYIERVKASDEIGRRKRIKPEQMLSYEDLYGVDGNENASSSAKCQIRTSQTKDGELSLTEIHERLRETMRIVKEKDELINKLRESCHDLAIKCADAENRVDELRFSVGRSSSSLALGKESHNGGSVLCGEIGRDNQHEDINPRRCASVGNISQMAKIDGEHGKSGERNGELVKDESSKMIDKATETAASPKFKCDVQTQIEPFSSLCQDEQFRSIELIHSEQEASHWTPEDHILMETCSNWMEKVRDWKTDSNFNLSQDSCGDRDSGFRGSAEIDIESIRLKQQRRSSLPRTKKKSHHHHHKHEERLPLPGCTLAQVPQVSPTTIADPHGIPCEDHSSQEHNQFLHFWPSFSTSQSNVHLSHHRSHSFQDNSIKAKSLLYEIAEAERNKYAHFQENFSSHPSQRLTGAKSLDVLYIPTVAHHTTEELRSLIDSSFDPPELILKSHLNSQQRSIDKKMKLLDPLLDDATRIALRVKRKSERLAKMLQDACTFE